MEINNQAAVNVYTILGEANMKKSSTIRCLSGIHPQGVYQIVHNNGSIRDTFIMVSSLQETRRGFNPVEFEQYVTNKSVVKKHYDDIFICLRIKEYFNPRSNRLLNRGEDYINHFRSIGWNVIEVVDFQHSNKGIPLGNIEPTLTILDTNIQPSNNIAYDVRQQFKWK